MAKTDIIPIPLKKDLGSEIATTGDSKDVLNPTVTVWDPSNFGVLQAVQGSLDTFEKVLTDSEVQATLSQRRLSIVSKAWNVDPGGDSPEDEAAAEHMREILKSLNWDDINDKMHYGIFYGFSVAELLYEIQDNKITVSEVKVKNRRRFRFGRAGELRLLTRDNPSFGEIMPPGKFWTFATGGDNHDNPYGIGLGHWLYWSTYFKSAGVKFWMIFLDKFAMPTAVAKHSFGDDKVKINQLLTALQAVHTDSGVAIPEGIEITLLEAARSGTSDYETLCKYMDRAIQKVVIGQTASSEGTAGKLGNEDLQGQVREDIIKADADLLCESWNRGPGRWLTAWNFPGAKPPRVWRDVEPAEDLAERADTDNKVSNMGFKPSLDYVKETYGEGWEKKEPLQLAPGKGPAAGDGEDPDQGTGEHSFAAAGILPPEDALELALNDLLLNAEELDEGSEQIIRPVFALVKRVGAERALGQFAELYPRISHEKLTEAIARANFISHILGRLNG